MSHLRYSSIVLLGATLLVVPRRASADTEAPPKPVVLPEVSPSGAAGMFGGHGQLAISNDLGLLISNTSLSGGGGSTTTIQLRPGIDYFIVDHLTIGAFIGFDYTHVPDSHTTIFNVGPRVGYDLPLSSMFSAWARLGFSYSDVNLGGAGGSTNASSFTLNLSVPFLLHVEHFFLGFGPALDVDLTGDHKSTTFAGRLTFGGWM